MQAGPPPQVHWLVARLQVLLAPQSAGLSHPGTHADPSQYVPAVVQADCASGSKKSLSHWQSSSMPSHSSDIITQSSSPG
jgi:hypothetical protein